MKNVIIAVDFDGTLCHGNWPDIGETNIRLINKLLKLQRKGSKLLRAYNVGCMMPYMNYEPRTLEEIVIESERFYNEQKL